MTTKTTKRRRQPGEGSIQQRADGRFVAVIDQGLVATGEINDDGSPKMRRDRKYFYGSSRAEVRERMKAARAQVSEGQRLPDAKVLVGEYVLDWLDKREPTRVKASTVEGYRRIVQLYVLPHLGAVKLADLDADKVQDWLTKLAKAAPAGRKGGKRKGAGLSPRTRRQAFAILRKALNDAVAKKKIPWNPCLGVEVPEIGRAKTDDALTVEQAQKLIATMKDERYKRWEPAFRLALSTGMRRGEVLGLRWSDVDLDEGTATIRRTVKYRPGMGVVVDTPKTSASARTVPVPPSCVSLLRTHKMRQPGQGSDDALVFATADGEPIDPRNMLRAYHSVTQAAGLGKRRLHGLRHTMATIMLAEGVALEVISEQLGHAGIQITKDVYAQVRQPALRGASDAMESALASVGA